MSYISPLAVCLPWCGSPYHDAFPIWTIGDVTAGGDNTEGAGNTSGGGDTSAGGMLTEVGVVTQPAIVSTSATPAIRERSIERLKVSIVMPTPLRRASPNATDSVVYSEHSERGCGSSVIVGMERISRTVRMGSFYL
jgi:hypothetical protein